MNLHDSENQLHTEGFTHTYVWQDAPGAFYPEHTHPTETAHIILDGEMTLTMQGQTHTFRAGDRCDVPLAQSIRPAWGRAAAATSSARSS